MLSRLGVIAALVAFMACGGSPPAPSPTADSAQAEPPTHEPTLTPLEADADSEATAPFEEEIEVDAPRFSAAQICKAGIGVTMGRDPAIMGSREVGDTVFLSYIREDDGTKWSYKCRLEGQRVMWASDGPNVTGRWRNHPADEVLVYRVLDNGHLEIEERYSDGSSTRETFAPEALGN